MSQISMRQVWLRDFILCPQSVQDILLIPALTMRPGITIQSPTRMPLKKDKPQKIEVKDGYFVHIFEGSGLCASSWKLLQAYPRNADNPVLYPGAERALTDGTYSATARENSVQHITAENYLVKAVKGKTSSGNQRFLWEYHVHGTSSLCFNLCRRL